MKQRNAEGLIATLARDLAPVRRIPRPEAVFAVVIALGLALPGLRALLGGPGLHSGGALDFAVLAGLALAALGGIVTALARAVPGRETVQRGAARTAGTGLLIALAALLLGLLQAAPSLAELDGSLTCTLRALSFGALPGLLVFAFVAYSGSQRSFAAAVGGLTGAAALGAFDVQATCPAAGALHQFVGHLAGPLLAALFLALPLAWWLARRLR